MKTLKDIAELAGVSTMTISRFFSAPEKLSKSTRKKIGDLVDEHNFTPNALAKSLITKKSGLIGVVVPDIRNPFFAQLYYRLETVLEPMGYSLMLCNSKEDAEKEEKYLRLLLSRQVEGILLIPVEERNVGLLKSRKQNFVLIERIIESVKTNMVSSDHYNGAYMAVEHLINLGHKNIAVLYGDTHLKPYNDRFNGYCDALKDNGIPLNHKLICETKINSKSAEEALDKIIAENNNISAIFSCNNLMSIGGINAIYKAKLSIPDDISFASFDELPRTQFIIPSITCVIQNTAKLAESAVELLMNQIALEQKEPKQYVVPVKLRKGK